MRSPLALGIVSPFEEARPLAGEEITRQRQSAGLRKK